MGTTTITKRILNLKVNLIVGKFLILALTIKKRPTKTISEDKTV